MVLVGSATFNMLVVTGISMLAAHEVKKIERFGAFVVTACFATFAYGWFFIVLCVTTPGYITGWEAISTLSLYFILVLCVYVSEKIAKENIEGFDELEHKNNRIIICRHML